MVDVNMLVKPGSTPLYLIFGNDINSVARSRPTLFNAGTREFRAAVATPWGEEHAHD